MSRSSLRKPLDALPSWSDAGECPGCGKRMYREKSDAKNAIKAKHPNDRMNVYRCVEESELVPNPRPWHIGHQPTAIRQGDATRGEWYSDEEFQSDDCSYIDNRENGTGMKCSLPGEHSPRPHLAMNAIGDWVNIDPSERCSV